MKDILRYKNGLNKLELGKMTSREQDVFFYILFLLSENKLETMDIKFSELKNLIGGKQINNEQFSTTVRKMAKKFQATVQEYSIEEGKYLIFNVLDDTVIDVKKGIITTGLKKNFRDLLEIDEKSKCYMTINLREMCNLKSSYLKILYRYIKQWEIVGTKTISIEDFKKMLDIPKAYRFYDIDRRILVPALDEFKELFTGFSIDKNNSSTKGKKIDELTFTWQIPEKKKKADKYKKEKIQEAPIRKKQGLGEEDLKKYEADKRLADIIETNLDSKVITNENSNAKVVSVEQFEEMYKEYLEENGISHARGIKLAFERSIASKYKIAN